MTQGKLFFFFKLTVKLLLRLHFKYFFKMFLDAVKYLASEQMHILQQQGKIKKRNANGPFRAEFSYNFILSYDSSVSCRLSEARTILRRCVSLCV